jgi:hypothetical protein
MRVEEREGRFETIWFLATVAWLACASSCTPTTHEYRILDGDLKSYRIARKIHFDLEAAINPLAEPSTRLDLRRYSYRQDYLPEIQ